MAFSFIKYLPITLECIKGVLTTAKHSHKIKTFDKTADKISTIEHMMIKLEKKLGDCRNEIENLRRQVVFSTVVNMILGFLIIFLVIFMK